MGNNKITLYPSNWLYNAGVLGFLRIIEFGDKKKLYEILERAPFYITFDEIEIVRNKFIDFIEKEFKPTLKKQPKDIRSLLFAKTGGLLPNLQQLTKYGIKSDKELPKWWNNLIDNALKEIKQDITNNSLTCKYCGNKFRKPIWEVPYDFWDKVYNTLMPSPFLENPNWLFYLQNDLVICGMCKIILILSNFIVSQRTELSEFVNVPSIKTLYFLNKLLLKLKRIETFKTLTPDQRLEALISEALLTYEFIKGAWILQNVELIQIEKGQQPKVYNLPISRFSAELIVRSDVRRTLGNIHGQITLAKKEKNSHKISSQREGIKRFLTGGEGSLIELAYFSFKNDFMENKSKEAKKIASNIAFNLAKLEKIKIDYKKERGFEMIKEYLINLWNIGKRLEIKDRNFQYELLSASLIEDKKRLIEFLTEIEKKNKSERKLAELKEYIESTEVSPREAILAFLAGCKGKESLTFEDISKNPLEGFWNEGKEIGEIIEKDIETKIKKYVFRIISKIRVGDRNGVLFEILKLYLLSEKPVPKFMAEILRDDLEIEKFKLYTLSFTSGFMGKDDEYGGDIIYEMRKAGEEIIDEKLEDRIKKHGYRLLSLIRAGLRAEFAYEIVKLFAQAKKEIPKIFLEILDPDKSMAEFQSFAYGILSGYLKEQKI